VHRGRTASLVAVRSGGDALHLGLHYYAVDDCDLAQSERTEKGRRVRPSQNHPIYALRHLVAGRFSVDWYRRGTLEPGHRPSGDDAVQFHLYYGRIVDHWRYVPYVGGRAGNRM